jgi:hypothetical protein
MRSFPRGYVGLGNGKRAARIRTRGSLQIVCRQQGSDLCCVRRSGQIAICPYNILSSQVRIRGVILGSPDTGSGGSLDA